MTDVRFQFLYRPSTKKDVLNIGVGVVDIPQVSTIDAPVVLRQDIFETWNKRHSTTEYRWFDGDLWIPAARVGGDTTGLDTISEPSADYAPRNTSDLWDASLVNPILPWYQDYSATIPRMYNYTEFNHDDDEMSDDLLSSTVWKAIKENVPEILLVDGKFYRKSTGPLHTVSSMDEGIAKTTCMLPWEKPTRPDIGTFTVFQAREMEELVAGRALEEFRTTKTVKVGEFPLAEIDPGYDPLPLAVEQQAWNWLCWHGNDMLENVSDQCLRSLIDLRNELDRLHGKPLDYRVRSAHRGDPRDPREKLSSASLSLIPLIHEVARTEGHPIFHRDLQLMDMRITGRLDATPHLDDVDALSLTFGAGHGS